jgi:hypothetical protein
MNSSVVGGVGGMPHTDNLVFLADSNATFPQKLFVMMEIEDGDIVHWAPHGFAFVVTNQDRFLKDIVPKYFKRKTLYSFIPASDLAPLHHCIISPLHHCTIAPLHLRLKPHT